MMKRHLGSSDVAAILGISPYRNATDVWLEATGRAEPIDHSDEMSVQIGVMVEPMLLDFAEQTFGPVQRRCEVLLEDARLCVHPDGIVNGTPIECKTGNIVAYAQHWGAFWTNDIPEHYKAQCLAHMTACNADTCYVPALIGGRGLGMYVLHSTAEERDQLARIVRHWVEKHIDGDVPPDNLPSPVLLARMKRDETKCVDVDSDLIDEYYAAKEAMEEANKKFMEVKIRIIHSLGDGTYGQDARGYRISYREIRRAGYTVEPTSYRSLIITRPKEQQQQ